MQKCVSLFDAIRNSFCGQGNVENSQPPVTFAPNYGLINCIAQERFDYRISHTVLQSAIKVLNYCIVRLRTFFFIQITISKLGINGQQGKIII